MHFRCWLLSAMVDTRQGYLDYYYQHRSRLPLAEYLPCSSLALLHTSSTVLTTYLQGSCLHLHLSMMKLKFKKVKWLVYNPTAKGQQHCRTGSQVQALLAPEWKCCPNPLLQIPGTRYTIRDTQSGYIKRQIKIPTSTCYLLGH